MERWRPERTRRVAGIVQIPALAACLVVGLVAPRALAVDLADGGRKELQLDRRDPVAGREQTVPLKDDPFKPPPRGEKAAIDLYQVFAMFFGTLVDNDGYVVLDHNDTIVADPDNLVYGGSPFSGEILITGDPFTSVRIGVTSSGAPGLTLTDFTSNLGPPPVTGATFDAAGELRIRLGAKLSLSTAAEPGENTPIGYTVSATYE